MKNGNEINYERFLQSNEVAQRCDTVPTNQLDQSYQRGLNNVTVATAGSLAARRRQSPSIVAAKCFPNDFFHNQQNQSMQVQNCLSLRRASNIVKNIER